VAGGRGEPAAGAGPARDRVVAARRPPGHSQQSGCGGFAAPLRDGRCATSSGQALALRTSTTGEAGTRPREPGPRRTASSRQKTTPAQSAARPPGVSRLPFETVAARPPQDKRWRSAPQPPRSCHPTAGAGPAAGPVVAAENLPRHSQRAGCGGFAAPLRSAPQPPEGAGTRPWEPSPAVPFRRCQETALAQTACRVRGFRGSAGAPHLNHRRSWRSAPQPPQGTGTRQRKPALRRTGSSLPRTAPAQTARRVRGFRGSAGAPHLDHRQRAAGPSDR
jgi:hypothetical protein